MHSTNKQDMEMRGLEMMVHDNENNYKDHF